MTSPKTTYEYLLPTAMLGDAASVGAGTRYKPHLSSGMVFIIRKTVENLNLRCFISKLRHMHNVYLPSDSHLNESQPHESLPLRRHRANISAISIGMERLAKCRSHGHAGQAVLAMDPEAAHAPGTKLTLLIECQDL